MKEEFKTTIYADTIEGKLGLGVDYYKGEPGKSGADEVYIGAEPPTDPQVKLWVDTEAQSVGAVDWNDIGNKPNFATVATSGSYNDLTDKPVIPEAPDLTPYAKSADLSTVATSGSYEDLTNKPNLFSGDYQDLTNKPNLFDGDYNNLTNKPTIPEPYTLPTASTDTLGGVKVDGSTITIADGVISSAGGGSSSNVLGGNRVRNPDGDITHTITSLTINGNVITINSANPSIYNLLDYSYGYPLITTQSEIELKATINGVEYTIPNVDSYSIWNYDITKKESSYTWKDGEITFIGKPFRRGKEPTLTITGIDNITSATNISFTLHKYDIEPMKWQYLPKQVGFGNNYDLSPYYKSNYGPDYRNEYGWDIEREYFGSVGNYYPADEGANGIYILGKENNLYNLKSSNNIIVGRKNILTSYITNTNIFGDENSLTTADGRAYQIDIWGNYNTVNLSHQAWAPLFPTFMIGRGLKTVSQGNLMLGQYNITNPAIETDTNFKQSVYSLLIGNGTSDDARSNALTVDTTGNLAIAGTMSSAGADYAEFFEWKDGNPEAEDRVGYIVSLDGDKLTLANEGDYILGVVSGTATVLGDNPEWNWAKRWVTDDFGRIQYEDKVIHHEAEERNGETIPAWDETIKAPITNPDYDPDQKYIKRADRPEWSAVGMMGKLYVRDDGTCQVNGFAKPINGVATASTSGTMRVIERVSDNVIRVVIK